MLVDHLVLLNELYERIGSQKSSGTVEAGYDLVSIIQRNYHTLFIKSRSLNRDFEHKETNRNNFLDWKCIHLLNYINENEIK